MANSMDPDQNLSVTAADDFSSRHFQMHFFLGTLRVNAGQNYRRMLQGEHSAILWTFIKLPFVFRIFVLFIFEWPLMTGFTVLQSAQNTCMTEEVWQLGCN